MQQYAGIYLLQNYSTCFGCPSHSSSGVHKTVTAASGTGHITYLLNIHFKLMSCNKYIYVCVCVCRETICYRYLKHRLKVIIVPTQQMESKYTKSLALQWENPWPAIMQTKRRKILSVKYSKQLSLKHFFKFVQIIIKFQHFMLHWIWWTFWPIFLNHK